MIIISAMSENRVIGSDDGMPWDVPAEYQQYLRFVRGNTVIMGRKSYQIFGPDLSADTNLIVITRSVRITGVEIASSLQHALALADHHGKPVFVAGGESIYAQALPLAKELYLSVIKGEFEGDAYFPEFDLTEWEMVQQRDEPEFLFRIYRRSKMAA